MKIACCQWDIAWENRSENYRTVRNLLAKTRLPPGSLLVLPEMFATGFSMNVPTVCEPSPSESERFLQSLAGELSLFLVAGLALLDQDGRPRNQAVIVGPEGQIIDRYNKIQPFTLGGESQQYYAGTEIVLFKWQQCTVAPLICYDLRFPELFRTAVRRGAQLFTVIANWPVKRDRHWVTLLQARAIENQAYVVGVNRCGTDPKHSYSGRTLIVDPHGNILTEMGNEEGIVSADLDLATLQAWRLEFPALQDMRWNS